MPHRLGSWAVEAIRWANAEGLVTGTSAATLTPKGQRDTGAGGHDPDPVLPARCDMSRAHIGRKAFHVLPETLCWL